MKVFNSTSNKHFRNIKRICDTDIELNGICRVDAVFTLFAENSVLITAMVGGKPLASARYDSSGFITVPMSFYSNESGLLRFTVDSCSSVDQFCSSVSVLKIN